MSKQTNSNFNWGTGLFVAITLFVVTTLSIVGYIISLDFDLVSKDHYEKGVQYEQQIQKIEQAADLEVPVSIQFSSTENSIEIVFPENITRQNPSGTVILYRPSDSSLDRSYSLSLNDDHIQKIDASKLVRGKWLVKVAWQAGEQSYFEETSIFI